MSETWLTVTAVAVNLATNNTGKLYEGCGHVWRDEISCLFAPVTDNPMIRWLWYTNLTCK